MKTDFTLNTTHLLIIAACIFLYFFFRQPAPVQAPPTITNNYYYDSSAKTPPNITISPVIRIPQGIPTLSHTDTIAIIQDYYVKKYDQRTFSDSNIDITSSDTLFMNSKLFSSLTYKWKKPILNERVVQLQPVPVNKVFGGLYTQVSGERVNFGPLLTLQNKKDQVITIGKDLFSNSWQGSVSFKISFRKK